MADFVACTTIDLGLYNSTCQEATAQAVGMGNTVAALDEPTGSLFKTIAGIVVLLAAVLGVIGILIAFMRSSTKYLPGMGSRKG